MPFAAAGANISSSAQLGTGVVKSAAILDDDIAKADIGTGAVGTDEIMDGEIVNVDISASAGIVDSKLAQITTAGKVSGAALNSLSSIPAGAGVIPSANLPGGGSTAGVSTGPASSTTQTVTHGLGKTPAIVRLHGMCRFQGGTVAGFPGWSEGGYHNATNKCIYFVSVAGNSGASADPQQSTTFSVRMDDGSAAGAVATGVVGNVGGTSFDIVWTVSGGSLAAAQFIWRAE